MELHCKIEQELFKMLIAGKEVSFPVHIGNQQITLKIKLGEISIKEMIHAVVDAMDDKDAV